MSDITTKDPCLSYVAIFTKIIWKIKTSDELVANLLLYKYSDIFLLELLHFCLNPPWKHTLCHDHTLILIIKTECLNNIMYNLNGTPA